MSYTERNHWIRYIVEIVLWAVLILSFSSILYSCSENGLKISSSERHFQKRNHFFIRVQEMTDEMDVNIRKGIITAKVIADTVEVLKIYEHSKLYVILLSDSKHFLRQVISLKKDMQTTGEKIIVGGKYYMHLVPQYREDVISREIISPLKFDKWIVYVQCIGGPNVYVSEELTGLFYSHTP